MLNFKITEQEVSLLSKLTARICYLKVISSGVEVSRGFCLDFMLVFNAFKCKKSPTFMEIKLFQNGKEENICLQKPQIVVILFFPST